MDKLEKLWLLSAELEGALLIMRKKDVELTPSVRQYFLDKTIEMQKLLEPDATVDFADEATEEELYVEPVYKQPESMDPADEEPSRLSETEEEVAENTLYEEAEDADENPEEQVVETVFEPVADPEPAVEPEPVATTEPAVDPEAEAEEIITEAEQQSDDMPVAEDELQDEYEDEQEQEPAPEVEPEPNPDPEPAVDPEPVTVAAEPVRLDEKLARHTSRDIHKAFTINDKFRFRRALFGNNSSQYNDALDLISQMENYDETADYFFTQYGWAPDDENVKAFMAIVKNHFEA